MPVLREKWERILSKTLTDAEWRHVLESPKKIPRNTHLKYLQFNYVHMTYMTPHRIQAAFGGEPRECPRCRQLDADFLHMTWSCTNMQGFWDAVMTKINNTLGRTLAHSVEVRLLGLYPRPPKRKLGH